MKYILKFYTTWSLILYLIFILTNNTHKLPDYISYAIINNTIMVGILGSIIFWYKKDSIINHFPLNLDTTKIVIINFLFHLLPMIHAILHSDTFISNSTKTSNVIIKSILVINIFTFSYLYSNKFNITDIYFGINTNYLILLSTIIYSGIILSNYKNLL